MVMTAEIISKILRDLADPQIAEHSQRFFKMGEGEYGAGDKFLGIRVPVIRSTAKQFRDTSLSEIDKLLLSPFNEERLCALLMLVNKFARSDEIVKGSIYQLYLDRTEYINNWNLVDSSAYQIVGAYLEHKDSQPIYDLAISTNLWERRIAIISTFHGIRQDRFDDALGISTLLQTDREDLIHKAVGWMLREIGKKNLSIEKDFLNKHYQNMPRTMLRYAIEKFPEPERQQYLQGTI
jgi:3-methyladenine DNA glycosylase AlkD